MEDVKEGDLLLGPDGKPRRAFNVVSGKERLYRIKIGKRQEDLVVTANHILVLHQEKGYGNHYNTVQTTAAQFATLDKKDRAKFRLFKSPGFELPEQAVPVDPYLLGQCLGDRSRRHKRSAQQTKFVTSGAIEQEDNGSIHIPSRYVSNSRSVRLEVLAGLVDSNGWYVNTKKAIGFTQSELHSVLFWDTVALARSLGFSVRTKHLMKWNQTRTRQIPQLLAKISGDVAEIPCQLTSKNEVEHLGPQSHSFMIKDISLESETTEWAGFRVDKDQLYLRHDYLVLHNSGFEEVCFISHLNTSICQFKC